MRTTIIPAQITTVEDTIAGNFNLTQITLFLTPLFIAICIYAILPNHLQFTVYKIPLIFLSFLICLTLAMRVKGRVVLNWIILLLRFMLRPKYYVFNKNDLYLRDIYKETLLPAHHRVKARATNRKPTHVAVSDLVKLEQLLEDQTAKLHFQFKRNGGVNVAFQQIKS